MAEPTLSAVIAAWPGVDGLDTCLQALEAQREMCQEIIVVASMQQSETIAQRFPWVTWLRADNNKLIPHLWGLGMAMARSDVVALTTSHFTPAANWAAAIRAVHQRLSSPAIGGRIEPPRGGGPVAWATYFLRYSGYLRFDREQALSDVAGDNASYKRAFLPAKHLLEEKGFWELDFHRILKANGTPPVFTPNVRVRQHASFGFVPFLAQRLKHGREFGRSRLRGRSPLIRILAAAATPLVPLVFYAKIVGRVFRSRWYFARLLMVTPVLMCFLLAWSIGEAWGYLSFGDAGAAVDSAQRVVPS